MDTYGTTEALFGPCPALGRPWDESTLVVAYLDPRSYEDIDGVGDE